MYTSVDQFKICLGYHDVPLPMNNSHQKPLLLSVSINLCSTSRWYLPKDKKKNLWRKCNWYWWKGRYYLFFHLKNSRERKQIFNDSYTNVMENVYITFSFGSEFTRNTLHKFSELSSGYFHFFRDAKSL